MQGIPNYSTLMNRRGEYSNAMLSEVNLPIDYKYERIPKKNEVICKYVLADQSMHSFYDTAWTHHLVFPYKDRTFWSIWVTVEDLSGMTDFIHRRLRAYPAGWVESRTGDLPKNIAKFLLINSLTVHGAGERVGIPSGVPLGIDGSFEIESGILDTNEILSSMFSIFSGIDVLEEYKWRVFNTSGLEEAILESTFPEYRKGVANKIYNKDDKGIKY